MGVYPVQQAVHHKTHSEKILALATTVFAPYDNDIEKGGVVYKISFIRAGELAGNKGNKRQLQASVSRNGTYYYPKIPENKLHSKGEMYFESTEITGSNQGTAENPKFSFIVETLEGDGAPGTRCYCSGNTIYCWKVSGILLSMG